MESCQDQNNGAAFLIGGLVTGGIAAVHNAKKDERHRQELELVYSQGYRNGQSQMRQEIDAKQSQLNQVSDLLKQKTTEMSMSNTEIARLNTIVETQKKDLVWHQLRSTARVFPPDGDANVDGMLN